MPATVDLLAATAQNAASGRCTLLQLRDCTANAALRTSLSVQQREYSDIYASARRSLQEYGKTPPIQPNLIRMGTYMLLKLKTGGHPTTRHLAELLIESGSGSIVQLTEALRDCPDADGPARSLAERLLYTEQRGLKELAGYL